MEVVALFFLVSFAYVYSRLYLTQTDVPESAEVFLPETECECLVEPFWDDRPKLISLYGLR